MKPVDVKFSTYIDLNKENNEKDPKFKIGDFVRTSKYKKNFARGYTTNQSEESFVIDMFLEQDICKDICFQ